MKTLIKNARIISPGIDMPGAAVEMEGKIITAVYPAGSELPAADKVVDAEGRMLLPGFIDIHSHGAGGCDTCDAKLDRGPPSFSAIRSWDGRWQSKIRNNPEALPIRSMPVN